MRNDGGNAFPNPQGDAAEERTGMSLLDYFAARALPAVISMSNRQDFDYRLEHEDFEKVEKPKAGESYWFESKLGDGTCWIMGCWPPEIRKRKSCSDVPHRLVTTIEERVAREAYKQAAAMVARRNKIHSAS